MVRAFLSFLYVDNETLCSLFQKCSFFFLPPPSVDKTIKLWKISERDKRAEGYNLKDEDGRLRDPFRITSLRVRVAVSETCLIMSTALCMITCLKLSVVHFRYQY